jgi:copper chaperone CopZ
LGFAIQIHYHNLTFTKRIFMKKILFVFFIQLFIYQAQAQLISAKLQASGLTCSMCSNAINKALKTLPFVEKVEAVISTSSFNLYFKPGTQANFDEIKNKVEDAGFAVAALTVTLQMPALSIKKDTHAEVLGSTFHFLNVKSQNLSGLQKITVLDKGFVSQKTFKKNSGLTSMPCYNTGKMSTCCSTNGSNKGNRVYHVMVEG